MRISKVLPALLVPAFAFSLEVQPWFCDVYEFHFRGSYSYSRFNTVQGAVPQITSPHNSNVIYGGLEFCPSNDWSVDTDVQVADTTSMPFNFRSFAFQVRYLWLDDIIGNPVSLATGGNFRITNEPSLHDLSCPSHANLDMELNFALGREFDYSDNWRWRLWAYGVLGQANVGSPWVRALAAIETNINETHKWGLFAIGSNGYGGHTHFNPAHFDGYAKIRQKSIDLALRYGYRMGVWGTLRAEYQRRVLAKACPENVNTVIFSYLVSFSF